MTQQELDKFLETHRGAEAESAIGQFNDAFNRAMSSGNTTEVERLNPLFTLYKGALVRKDQVAGFQEANNDVVNGQVVGRPLNFANPPAGMLPGPQAIANAVNQSTGIFQGGQSALPLQWATPPSGQPRGDAAIANINNQVDSIMEAVITSGKTLSPDLTPEDLAGITPDEFMRQAGLVIAPEYQEKFNTVKDEITRNLSNIGYDLNLKKQNIARVSERTLEQGTEDLAGRGLAFSGARERFIGDVAGARERDEEAARTLAFRGAQEFGSKAEGLVGTENLRSYLGGETIDNQSPFQYGSAPRTGSLTLGQRTDTAKYAQDLESRAREMITRKPNIDRASIQRALSFA